MMKELNDSLFKKRDLKRVLVSYIIVTHNRRNFLRKLLDSVITQRLNREFEIIIVDDASTDGTYDFLQEFVRRTNRYNVKVLRNNSQRFVAPSRNIGAKVAQGEYLFFIDDDVELDKNCTKELIDFLEDNSEFAVASPLILDAKSNVWCCGIKRSYLGLNYRYISRESVQEYYIVDEAVTAYVIRNSDFKKIGGYNNKYLFYYEESEMFHRLKLITHKKIACLTKAKAYHNIEEYRLWKLSSLKSYLLGRNRIWFYKEWCNSQSHYVLCALIWIIICLTYYLINFTRFKNLIALKLLLKGINHGLRTSP